MVMVVTAVMVGAVVASMVAILVMAAVTVVIGMAEAIDLIMVVMRQHQYITHHNRIMLHKQTITAMVSSQCTDNIGEL
jgi:hypothetical protein